jgi:hypothetical protein
MMTIEVACRHASHGWNCGAEAGEACRWFDGHGAIEPMGSHFYHAERMEDAAGMSDAGDAPSEKAFDDAVEKTGLV